MAQLSSEKPALDQAGESHSGNGQEKEAPKVSESQEKYINELRKQAEKHRQGKKKSPYKIDPLAPYKGVIPRYFEIQRHLIGLLAGGLIAFVNALPPDRKRGLRSFWSRFFAFLLRPFVMKEIRNEIFPVQLRRRLEILGPTYIKLGQILALREDILPKAVTKELQNLLDRLPEVPYDVMEDLIRYNLGKPLDEVFTWIDPDPLGSASIAQTHVARTVKGEKVVLKVVKPGIRDVVLTDINLLKLLGYFLEIIIPQYQPRQLIDEFCHYTAKEVDLVNEADNAETFIVNFADLDDVVFPEIYREYSNENMLVMELLDGFKPGTPKTDELTEEERENLIDNGAAGIIRMLYKDGFFHADLHPGNLFILEGGKVGFIDLGMVGRFEDKTRRQMLYYFHALVTGDIEGAARYLTAMARVGKGGNLQAFRRSVTDLLRRFKQQSRHGKFSMGKMIIESLGIGARHRVFFPVEMTLMVKALVTFEGVGLRLNPKLDIPTVSQKHINQIFRDQFSPSALSKELMRGMPELIDVIVRMPRLIGDGLKEFEDHMNDTEKENPLEGIRSSIIASACLIAAVITVVLSGPWFLWVILFFAGFLFYMFGK